MTVRTGIIAASATSAAPASAPTAGCGSNFAAGNAEPGRVFIRLRRKPGLIELGRMRLRRGGGPLGRLILCARFRGITHRRIVRRLRRHGLNGFRVLVLGRRGFECGGQKLFAVEYIESDLAVTALQPGAHSNLFVYLEGRRFGFDLSTGSPGDEIVLVRDSADRKMKVKAHD